MMIPRTPVHFQWTCVFSKDLSGDCSMVAMPPVCTQAYFQATWRLPPKFSDFDQMCRLSMTGCAVHWSKFRGACFASGPSFPRSLPAEATCQEDIYTYGPTLVRPLLFLVFVSTSFCHVPMHVHQEIMCVLRHSRLLRCLSRCGRRLDYRRVSSHSLLTLDMFRVRAMVCFGCCFCMRTVGACNFIGLVSLCTFFWSRSLKVFWTVCQQRRHVCSMSAITRNTCRQCWKTHSLTSDRRAREQHTRMCGNMWCGTHVVCSPCVVVQVHRKFVSVFAQL